MRGQKLRPVAPLRWPGGVAWVKAIEVAFMDEGQSYELEQAAACLAACITPADESHSDGHCDGGPEPIARPIAVAKVDPDPLEQPGSLAHEGRR